MCIGGSFYKLSILLFVYPIMYISAKTISASRCL